MPQFKLKDGRELEIADNGINSAKALVFHHGTPGHSTTWSTWLEYAASRGARAISYSRAGYGTSDRDFNRRVIDINDDIAAVLDAKGVTDFVSIGWSGGGPHALANAFEPRNKGAITLAGVGMYGAEDLNFLEGMGQENHDEFGAALKGEEVLQEWLHANAGEFKNVTGAQIRAAFGGLVGPADKAVLSGAFAEDCAATMRSALAVSFDGWIDDDLAFVKGWGFSLADIKVPVLIWQGDEDLMVPHAHSQWQAQHIPGAQLCFVPGNGHITLITQFKGEVINRAIELLE